MPFFLSRAPTHPGVTFNLRFLYELKHKTRLPNAVCWILHFRFHFAFIKVYIFVHQKAWTLLLWNVIISFKIKIIKKPHTVLFPQLWFLSCNKKIKIQCLRELELPKNWPGDKFFKPRKSKFWECLKSNFYVNIWHSLILRTYLLFFLTYLFSLIELKTFLYLIIYLFLSITYLFL